MSEMERRFISQAAHANLEEIRAGELAGDKAILDGVRQYGQRLIEDHRHNLDRLKQVADTLGCQVPQAMGPHGKALAERLSGMQGHAFDQGFVEAMTAGHRHVIEQFRLAISQLGDGELRDYALQTVPVLDEHLAMAQALLPQVRASGVSPAAEPPQAA